MDDLEDRIRQLKLQERKFYNRSLAAFNIIDWQPRILYKDGYLHTSISHSVDVEAIKQIGLLGGDYFVIGFKCDTCGYVARYNYLSDFCVSIFNVPNLGKLDPRGYSVVVSICNECGTSKKTEIGCRDNYFETLYISHLLAAFKIGRPFYMYGDVYEVYRATNLIYKKLKVSKSKTLFKGEIFKVNKIRPRLFGNFLDKTLGSLQSANFDIYDNISEEILSVNTKGKGAVKLRDLSKTHSMLSFRYKEWNEFGSFVPRDYRLLNRGDRQVIMTIFTCLYRYNLPRELVYYILACMA